MIQDDAHGRSEPRPPDRSRRDGARQRQQDPVADADCACTASSRASSGRASISFPSSGPRPRQAAAPAGVSRRRPIREITSNSRRQRPRPLPHPTHNAVPDSGRRSHRGTAMKQCQLIGCAAVLVALVSSPSPASAQISEERIRELVREAAKTAEQTGAVARASAGRGADGGAYPGRCGEVRARAEPRHRRAAVEPAAAGHRRRHGAGTFYGPTLTSKLGQNHNINAPTSQLQLSQGGGGVTNQTFTYNAGVTQELHVGRRQRSPRR